MSWVHPDFSIEGMNKKSSTQAEPSNSSVDYISSSDSSEVCRMSIWTEYFAPDKKDQLAVHIRKVQDVEKWLKNASSNKVSPIALCVGPSGSGKTITIQLVAKSFGFNVKEWINPIFYGRSDNVFGNSVFEFGRSTNQVEQFEEFLFCASRYLDLWSTKSVKSLLLVEDFPNIFLREPSLLVNTLRKYVRMGRSPLVFICSNGSMDIERTVFKETVMNELKITKISFNPVNKTLLTRGLERVKHLALREYPGSIKREKVCLADIAAFSNGDIRFAVNHLQFLCQGNGVHNLPSVPQSSASSEATGHGITLKPLGKDQKADIFKCLGRVLYSSKQKVVDQRTQEVKEEPVPDPAIIASKMSSMPNLFHGLLVENYPRVINSIGNISKAAELLVQADIMLSRRCRTGGNETEVIKKNAMYITVLGLMTMPRDSGKRKFMPFRGSRYKELMKTMTEREEKCRKLFPAFYNNTQTFMTEVCPHLAQANPPYLTKDQKKFIQECSLLPFTSSLTVENTPMGEQNSGDEEIVGDSEEEDVPSPVEHTIVAEADEDELNIEESYSGESDLDIFA